MKSWTGAKSLLAAIVLIAASAGPSMAHRFNVALVIPLTGADADRGSRFRAGFMLATTERDAHANEESDGHLGGLDVYVSGIDSVADVSGEIGRIVSGAEIDIVAAMGSPQTLSLIENRLAGENIAFVPPGQPPFPASGSAPEVAFRIAFESRYGRKPTPDAARGYAEARRIDIAVRAQGGVAQTDDLRRSFAATATGFRWDKSR